jgi:hypothetical protein
MIPVLTHISGNYFQLREIELRVQREINEKRQELLAKEESLRFDISGSTYWNKEILTCDD